VTEFSSLDALTSICATLPDGDAASAAAVRARQSTLTKPEGSLGRLEESVAWLATWQRRAMPRLERIAILIFAGNHGVIAKGVSPFPPAVTEQMVGNFANRGAAINQIAGVAGASLRVVALGLDRPTTDFTTAPAMTEEAFLAAVTRGYAAVDADTDLLCLGEMGIGNTTAAAALAGALFGGGGSDWTGRGTGVDDAGLARKIAAVDAGLARHLPCSPLDAARCLGGHELAAILGATIAARRHGIPVLLDGFVCTAAAAPLARLSPNGLDHAMIGHVSAEAGHRKLADLLGKRALLDLDMRLGEGSGAAVASLVLKAAVACHIGMASFAEAAVSGRS
jgi:nicotinate-nucleotide--dimethylbenzimidazole phosphoribosyltransferase